MDAPADMDEVSRETCTPTRPEAENSAEL